MKNKQNNLIVKHNKLIEAKYKLSLQEQKLILILASRINKDDENFNKQVFSVIELAEILGINKEWYYSEIKEVTKKLINRVIEIRKGNKFLQVAFLEYAEYLEDEGTVELQFSSKLKSYFLQLKNNFTKYYLKNVIKFESIYSIRIYELLKQYERIKSRRFEIKKLKEILGIEDKYSRYYDFKKRILFQAQEEINEKSDLEIDFEEMKTGRKVTAIKFIIKKKKNLPKELRFKENIEKQEYSPEVIELFRLLPQQEQLEAHKKELEGLLTEHSFRYLKADIDYAKKAQPDNFMGFLKASCQGGHYSTAEMEKKAKEEELARKREEAERKRRELEERIEKKAREMAVERYVLLAEKELKKYNQEYEKMTEVVPEKFRPNKKDFIIGALEDKFKEELRELIIES
ncbi:plasmid replication initiation protein [Orenia metallireducens]|uniref:Protein involved in initiation of plasmid replication n=1 Tax=Orenia metallireducens TaxID=1413210 RepID=A0A285I435_9FIRM|nr:replication initiation protein [Orenia metallireducens]PRX23155.1 plasmid replication initiation protein [Orenia metallireducens]SNY42704.1 Protein involved in initiation of plasmid replication [Orenia metallireducens]